MLMLVGAMPHRFVGQTQPTNGHGAVDREPELVVGLDRVDRLTAAQMAGEVLAVRADVERGYRAAEFGDPNIRRPIRPERHEADDQQQHEQP